jgi:hypothetical protein
VATLAEVRMVDAAARAQAREIARGLELEGSGFSSLTSDV